MKTFKKWFKPVNKKIKYDVNELKQGDKVEKEHTTDEGVADTIAKHHLAEDPKYYTKLKKIHKEK
jgi:hypothetical protein